MDSVNEQPTSNKDDAAKIMYLCMIRIVSALKGRPYYMLIFKSLIYASFSINIKILSNPYRIFFIHRQTFFDIIFD